MEIRTRGSNYVFNPMEGETRRGVKVEESQLLFTFAGKNRKGELINPEGYPANPCGNHKSVWKELYLGDARKMGVVGDVNRLALINHMSDVLFSKYRSHLLRCSSSNASFARLVIHIALIYGFRETIISVDTGNLVTTGLKITAARGVLHRLHALGIIIYLRGSGTGDKEKINTPMGFVLHPCIEHSMVNYLELLDAGKLDLEGLKHIDVKVRDIGG